MIAGGKMTKSANRNEDKKFKEFRKLLKDSLVTTKYMDITQKELDNWLDFVYTRMKDIGRSTYGAYYKGKKENTLQEKREELADGTFYDFAEWWNLEEYFNLSELSVFTHTILLEIENLKMRERIHKSLLRKKDGGA
jgi:hypothetical protein